MTSGAYKIPKIAASFSNCLTNTTPVASMEVPVVRRPRTWWNV